MGEIGGIGASTGPGRATAISQCGWIGSYFDGWRGGCRNGVGNVICVPAPF